MFSDRLFRIAFLISIFLHGFIILQNTNLGIRPGNKKPEEIEVRYVKAPSELKGPVRIKPVLRDDVASNVPARITLDRTTPSVSIDKDTIFRKRQISLPQVSMAVKSSFPKPDSIAVKKKITLPPQDMDKISSPSYKNYYQAVREKIRHSAYQNYNRAEEGQVYLSFVISSEGFLKDVVFVSEKSSPSSYLKTVALRSIRDASPFPKFPKELDYPQLSFNVVISFEIE